MRIEYKYENFDIENFFMNNLNNKSNLILVASRPGIGKTTFAFNLVVETLKHNKKAMINSLEMNVIDLSHKICAVKNHIPIESADKELKLKEKYNINEKMKTVFHVKNEILYLSNENNTKIILSDIEKFMNKNSDVSLIIIDYLQLFDFNNIDIETFVKNLKLITSNYNVTILILSQLDRKIEYRENKIPQKKDIREFQVLSEYIDQFIFLYKKNDKVRIKQLTNLKGNKYQ